jgi:hypothetical protein
LADSAVRDLNLFGCSSVSDVTMLGNVKKLNIYVCLNIIDLTGLVSLTELEALSPNRSVDIRSGFETFSQLSNLRVAMLPTGHEMNFAELLKKAPLKSLYLSEWRPSPTMMQILNSVRYLQTLELRGFLGDLTIPPSQHWET